MSDPYNGLTRKQYLCELSAEYGVPRNIVFMLAAMLGPNEDFDGLITELQDTADSGEFSD